MSERPKETGESLIMRYKDNDMGTSMRAKQSLPRSSSERTPSTWIYVVKAKNTPRRVNLLDLDTYKAQGWREWHMSRNDPLEEGTLRETRKIWRPEDVKSTDNPAADTLQLFSIGVGISTRADGIRWTDDRLLGWQPETNAVLSNSESFIETNDPRINFQPATSRGHAMKFPHPGLTGAGWGGL
jgi:hypothetical protein